LYDFPAVSNSLKVLLIFALAALCVRLAVAFLKNKQNRLQTSGVASISERKNPYLSLREQALHLKRDNIGLPVPSNPKEPWAAIMDWGVTNGTATVVAISDGTASVYISSGGGFIGGGQSHEPIRKAAQKMVSVAAEIQPQMRAAQAYPLPQLGQVTFYVLTDSGVFTTNAPQEELSSHRHLLSKLGDAAQDIITQYRLIEKAQ